MEKTQRKKKGNAGDTLHEGEGGETTRSSGSIFAFAMSKNRDRCSTKAEIGKAFGVGGWQGKFSKPGQGAQVLIPCAQGGKTGLNCYGREPWGIRRIIQLLDSGKRTGREK